MKRTRFAVVGLAVTALFGMSWLATAFVPMVEQAPPQKVAEEGGCVFPITSPDGLYSACVDGFGQVIDFSVAGIPGDQVFETLLYEANTFTGGLSRRVETAYVVAAGPIVSPAGDSTWTRLSKADGTPVSIEIINRMINGGVGGVQIQVRCENKGTSDITCKLFYYCDFDILPLAGDDEAAPVFQPGTGRFAGIEQFNTVPPANLLRFGGCPNYKSWAIGTWPALRASLDGGVPQLPAADATVPGPLDHAAAIAGDEVALGPGQISTFEVGIGPQFSKCKSKCPYDCDGSNDGIVGINDFLALLAQWGVPGASCDKTTGDVGVGINDFLALLAAWGDCPVNGVKCCLPIDLEAYCADPTADPPEACVDADTCAECDALGGLCVAECNLIEQTITVIDESAPAGECKHTTWTALVCAPKAPCVCGSLIDALFTSASPCGAGQGTHVEFGGPIPPIPPGFFGPGSDPFLGQVCLKGEPLGPTPFGPYDVADTLVRRSGDPFQCTDPFPASAVVAIEIVALNLVSIDPIVVTEFGGQNPQLWDVRVTLSEAPQQQGLMEVQKTHQNGGQFFSNLPVTPLLIFTQVGNPGNQQLLDLGGLPPVQLFNSLPIDWVHDVKLGTLAPEGPPSCFNPGIKEDNP